MSVDYEILASTVFDSHTNKIRKDTMEQLDPIADRVVLIDLVSLANEFRGLDGGRRLPIDSIPRQPIGDLPRAGQHDKNDGHAMELHQM